MYPKRLKIPQSMHKISKSGFWTITENMLKSFNTLNVLFCNEFLSIQMKYKIQHDYKSKCIKQYSPKL